MKLYTLSLLFFATSGFAGERYINCDNGDAVAFTLSGDVAGGTANASFAIFEALDSGPLHHHHPIFLPSHHFPSVAVEAQTQGAQTTWEGDGLLLTMDTVDRNFQTPHNFFRIDVLESEGLLGQKLTFTNFQCHWTETYTPPPPVHNCNIPGHCH